MAGSADRLSPRYARHLNLTCLDTTDAATDAEDDLRRPRGALPAERVRLVAAECTTLHAAHLFRLAEERLRGVRVSHPGGAPNDKNKTRSKRHPH